MKPWQNNPVLMFNRNIMIQLSAKRGGQNRRVFTSWLSGDHEVGGRELDWLKDLIDHAIRLVLDRTALHPGNRLRSVL